MIEVTELYTVGSAYDKQTESYASRKIQDSLGVFVVIDNEEDFRKVAAKPDEVEIWKQKLSQQVWMEYESKEDFSAVQTVSYKEEGMFIFYLEKISLGVVYGGHLLVVHYQFASTAS